MTALMCTYFYFQTKHDLMAQGHCQDPIAPMASELAQTLQGRLLVESLKGSWHLLASNSGALLETSQ